MKTILLDKGIVHLMLSFRLRSGSSSDFGNIENEIWTRTSEDIPRLDFLLEHVKKFFTKNAVKDFMDESACLILKLKTEALPVKMFNNKTYWISNKPFDKHQGTRNLQKFATFIDPLHSGLLFIRLLM